MSGAWPVGVCGLSFPSVEAAVAFAWSPPLHSGDRAEVAATLVTIRRALEALRARDPAAHDVFVLRAEGCTMRQIAERGAGPTTALPRTEETVGRYHALATAFLLGALRGVVVRGSAADELDELRAAYPAAWVVRVLQAHHRRTLREIEAIARKPETAPAGLAGAGLPRDAASLSRLSGIGEAFVVAHRMRTGRRP